MEKRGYQIISTLLLLFFVGQVLLEIIIKSPTIDEPSHIFSGYSYITGKPVVYNPGNPMLIKSLAAIPLLFMDLEYRAAEEPGVNITTNMMRTHYLGVEFLDYNSNTGNDKWVLYSSRAMIMLVGVLLGFYVYKWAKELYGIKAGVFALMLYCFEPNLIANSGLVTMDLGLTAFMFITVYYLFKNLMSGDSRYLILCGIFLGFALLSKYVAFILLAIIFLLISLNLRAPICKRILRGVLIFAVILAIGFMVVALSGLTDLVVYNLELERMGIPIGVSVPLLVPAYYSVGLNQVLSIVSGGHPNFMMGEHRHGTWWSYPFIAFLVKTPVTLILLIVSVLAYLTVKRRFMMDDSYLLLPPFTVVFYFAFISNTITGLKYILPAYPFLIVFASQIVNHAKKSKHAMRVIAVLLVYYFVSVTSASPHYLAYFNELAGGPRNGYNFLVDTNLDWGQDYWLLEDYLRESNLSDFKATIFFHPAPYFKPLQGDTGPVPCEPENGTFIISASSLAGLFQSGTPHEINCYAWLRAYDPEEIIGYSVFVYNITPESRPHEREYASILERVAHLLRDDPLFDFKNSLHKGSVSVVWGDNTTACVWDASRILWVCSDIDWNTVGLTQNWVGGPPFECIWAHPVEGKTIVIEFPKVPAGKEIRVKAALVDSALGCLDEEEVKLSVNVLESIQEALVVSKNQTTTGKTIPLEEDSEINVTFIVSSGSARCKHFCFDAVLD